MAIDCALTEVIDNRSAKQQRIFFINIFAANAICFALLASIRESVVGHNHGSLCRVVELR